MIEEAVKILKQGGVVVYPTDTAYGLGVPVNDLSAVNKLFKVKKRETDKAVSIVVGSLKQAQEIAHLNKNALKLWRAFLPGGLTLVVELLPPLIAKKTWQAISGGGNTIGLRMPDHPLPLKIVKKLGVPITTTSANIAGQPTCYTVSEVRLQFKGKKYQPDFYVDGGKLKKGRISTVVDCTGEKIKILREGSIKTKDILKCTS